MCPTHPQRSESRTPMGRSPRRPHRPHRHRPFPLPAGNEARRRREFLHRLGRNRQRLRRDLRSLDRNARAQPRSHRPRPPFVTATGTISRPQRPKRRDRPRLRRRLRNFRPRSRKNSDRSAASHAPRHLPVRRGEPIWHSESYIFARKPGFRRRSIRQSTKRPRNPQCNRHISACGTLTRIQHAIAFVSSVRSVTSVVKGFTERCPLTVTPSPAAEHPVRPSVPPHPAARSPPSKHPAPAWSRRKSYRQPPSSASSASR